MKSRLFTALASLTLLCGCGSATAPSVPGATVTVPPPGRATVYAALGASETAGAGATSNRGADAWPAVFFRTALPTAATYYNFGIAGETTGRALTDELPAALALKPGLATVWFNVDDLVFGVDAATYEANLDALVHRLRQGGSATVLVANTPVLDGLPLVRACLGEGAFPPSALAVPAGVPAATGRTVGACPIRQRSGQVWTTAALDAQVAAYNAAIARVVVKEGARLVDLHAQGDVATLHPADVDPQDGFHPSEQGHIAIAALFAATLASAPAP